MSALTLTLREEPPQRCDLSSLVPEKIREFESVEKIEIQSTNEKLCVGDIFRVTPGDPEDIRIEGGSDRFDKAAWAMRGPRLTITGGLGQMAGAGMQGGTLVVSGSVGRLAGASMRGGRIEIGGDAGDLAGGPLHGETAGMRGGILRIRGNAGERAGDRMRRGLLVIEGRAGKFPASRMIGGTLACFGEAGALPGFLMRRGTVILARGAEEFSPTFIDTGVHELVAMRLIARWLIDEGIEGGSLLASTLRRLAGDTAVLGKGEIFVPA